MGLSTKQVSIDGHGWEKALLQSGTLELSKPSSMKKQPSQQLQQQQQGEQLKCPRCDSTNTKFCYYNNYNKSQPRHFCKACKRHWTKGGTLRNVPVGGGRKNKRKTPNNATKTTSKIAPATNPTTTLSGGISNNNMTQVQPQKHSFPIGALTCVNERNFSDLLYQNFGKQPTCSMLESDISLYNKNFNENNNGGNFLTSTLSLLQNDHQDPSQFAYSNLGNFESNPCSISPTISIIQSSNIYNYSGDQGNVIIEDKMVNNSTKIDLSSSSISDQQQPTWQISSMDMPNNWGWDDFEKFVSVDPDLDVPWDDTEIKP